MFRALVWCSQAAQFFWTTKSFSFNALSQQNDRLLDTNLPETV